MVTASHLPSDRNGFKFFSKHAGGGFNKSQIYEMISIAQKHTHTWFDMGILPPTSGSDSVFCSEYVNWMPHYEEKLQRSLWEQVNTNDNIDHKLPLDGLNIVLNAGNGSGGFFRNVLEALGAGKKKKRFIVLFHVDIHLENF
jgi:phosphomannomutase